MSQPCAKRVLIDQLWRFAQLGDCRRHFAGDRAVDIGRRFHRFDHRAGLTCAELSPLLRNFDEYEVTERVLSVIGNADLYRAVLEVAHPFVCAGVLEIRRNIAHERCSPV